MKTKKITQFIVAVSILAITISCSKDNSALTPTGSVTLKAKATLNKVTAKTAAYTKTAATITITSFKVNIKKIEFNIKDNDTLTDNLYSDLELNGPFELNLASGNASVDITAVQLPNNIYDKIQFELHKSINSQSDMLGKSIEIKGTIDGTPFVFWSDAEDEMEVNFASANVNVVVNGTATSTTINFNLDSIFGVASTIDFSTAVDGNSDGIIEIDSKNTDGNADLARIIKNILEQESDIEND